MTAREGFFARNDGRFELVRLLLVAREVTHRLRILERVVHERHVLVLRMHMRRALVVALVALVLQRHAPPPLHIAAPALTNLSF